MSSLSPDSRHEIKKELERIRSSAIVAFLLFLSALLVDGPVTIIGWMLIISGSLCVLYVGIASTIVLRHTLSQNANPEKPHAD